MKGAFIHIPKTAGTFVRNNLLKRGEDVGCAYPSPPFKTLAKMNEAELSAFRKSEIAIGHESLCSFRHVLPDGVPYFTIVRNPVDRLISYYNHAMTHFPRYAESKVSLLRFLQNEQNVEVDNLQTRYLCGNPLTDPVDNESLDRAKAHIVSGLVTVGLQENLRASLLRMGIFATDLPIDLTPQNKSTFGFSRASLAGREIAVIRRLNALDVELYNFCRKEWARRA